MVVDLFGWANLLFTYKSEENIHPLYSFHFCKSTCGQANEKIADSRE